LVDYGGAAVKSDIYEVRRTEAEELSRKLARDGIHVPPWRVMEDTYWLDDRIPPGERERPTVDPPSGAGRS
jgi:hypothetical protein